MNTDPNSMKARHQALHISSLAQGEGKPSQCSRLPYRPPRLLHFGDVGSLTETGSMAGAEDNNVNGMCNLAQINMTFNMC